MPRLDAERVALWRQFTTVATEVQRRIDARLTEVHGMPLSWFEVLSALRDAGGSMRIRELCDAVHDNGSSLSRRLDRLEEIGYVRRKPSPTLVDKRAVSVAATRAGREMWRDANITYRRVVQQQFAQRLTDADVAALQRFLAKTGT